MRGTSSILPSEVPALAVDKREDVPSEVPALAVGKREDVIVKEVNIGTEGQNASSPLTTARDGSKILHWRSRWELSFASPKEENAGPMTDRISVAPPK